MDFKQVMQNRVSRRKFIAGASAGMGAAAAVSFAAGCSGSSNSSTPTPTTPSTGVTDTDIFNFALNLEYLEAEYYLLATTGSGLSAADAGSSAGAVTGGSQVPFKTAAYQEMAMQIANDELAHVRFLRSVLGSAAVSRPAIDFTDAFNAAASAAGIGSSFNPFATEQGFFIGGFTFEDVGVTAYHGAATLISDKKTNLPAAAGILATEGYHAAALRTVILTLGTQYITYANQISALRGTAGGGAETTLTPTTVTAADAHSIAYDRTTSQVLHIVYLSPAAGVVSKGGFFPNGMNGTITASAS